MIIHALPINNLPCGGIKTHYDLCEVERELGINSVIAFDSLDKIPQWLSREVGKVLTYKEAKDIAFREREKGKSNVVVGWEDYKILNECFPVSDFIHICYIQGHVFWQGFQFYVDKYLWFVSNFVKRVCNSKGFVIEPFIRPEIFYPSSSRKFNRLPYKVLVQSRKGGREAVDRLKNLALGDVFFNSIFEFDILEDVNEVEFSNKLRKADIFLAHSYPEGFNLPPLEAFASKTLVVGFSGEGGDEYMVDNENCFIVPSGDYYGLLTKFLKILKCYNLDEIIENGYKVSKGYSKENTKNKLITHLKYLEVSF